MNQVKTRWHCVADASVLVEDACARIMSSAARAIAARGRFSIVLAGGGTPLPVYGLLRSAPMQWQRWHVYFGDERCLDIDAVGRNSLQAQQAWLDHVPIPREQIHVIPAEKGAQEGARLYSNLLGGVADFDLVILGLGEDGHTASLFPGHEWGRNAQADDALAVFDSPKPPPERVSMSAHRLARAHAVLYLVDGQSKRDAVRRWQAGEPIPAAAITPASGLDVLLAM